MIEEVTPSGSVYYIREPNGALIARVVGTVLDATTTRYYHFDALGSTRKLTDKDGVVTDTYSYDAWGNTTHTGSTEQPYQHVGQLGYYTHYQDENLDLLQLGVRFYDPETGRFTQKDPAEDGLNWYGYAGGNPIANVDPWGLAWWEIWKEPPPWWIGFVPVLGPAAQATYDFSHGDYVMGAVNITFAASDVVAGGSFYRMWGKTLWKGKGSHTWGATRKWLGRQELVSKGQEVHHWFFRQNSWWGKRIPDWIKNQPWNLMPMDDLLIHDALHGQGVRRLNPVEWIRYGVPTWAELLAVSGMGKIGYLMGRLASNCE